jgi:hypothetical protein
LPLLIITVAVAKLKAIWIDHDMVMQADLADAGVEALPLPTLPLAAFVTGALSGLFGIGGGLLLNPVLLQIGIPPQVVRYTTTTPRAFAFLPNVAAAPSI